MAHSLSAYGAKMYAELQLAIAETYGVELSSKQFSVEPSVAQELNDAITAKSDFLQRINVIPVTEIKGQKVFIGVSGPVTGRTNTKTTDREAKMPRPSMTAPTSCPRLNPMWACLTPKSTPGPNFLTFTSAIPPQCKSRSRWIASWSVSMA